jgi:large subunit ribosomal protein L23
MSAAARHYDTILAPVITEKSTLISDQNKYVFFVPLNSKKNEIAEAVEALFKVRVTAVNTIKVHGKTKRFKGVAGKRNDQKKAIVTIQDGQTIDVTTGL